MRSFFCRYWDTYRDTSALVLRPFIFVFSRQLFGATRLLWSHFERKNGRKWGRFALGAFFYAIAMQFLGRTSFLPAILFARPSRLIFSLIISCQPSPISQIPSLWTLPQDPSFFLPTPTSYLQITSSYVGPSFRSSPFASSIFLPRKFDPLFSPLDLKRRWSVWRQVLQVNTETHEPPDYRMCSSNTCALLCLGNRILLRYSSASRAGQERA